MMKALSGLEGLLEIVSLEMITKSVGAGNGEKCQGWYTFKELEGESSSFYELQH